jgi:hypothetical protein
MLKIPDCIRKLSVVAIVLLVVLSGAAPSLMPALVTSAAAESDTATTFGDDFEEQTSEGWTDASVANDTTGSAAVAEQDLSTYTQYDPNNVINVDSANGYTATGASADGSFRLYSESSGIGRQNAELQYSLNYSEGSHAGVLQLGFGTEAGSYSSQSNWIGMALDDDGSVALKTKSGSKSLTTLSNDTSYYVSFSVYRTNATIVGEVYSDSARTSLVASQSMHFDPNANYDVTFAALARGGLNSGSLDATVRNFDVSTSSVSPTPYDDPNALDFSKLTIQDTNDELSVISPNELRVNDLSAGSTSRAFFNNSSVSEDVALTSGESGELRFDFQVADTHSAPVRVGYGNENATAEAVDKQLSIEIHEGSVSLWTDHKSTSVASYQQGERYFVSLELNRTSETATAKVYSDSDRTSLIGSESIAYSTIVDHRYLYAAWSKAGSGGGLISTDIRNLNVSTWDAPAYYSPDSAEDLRTYQVDDAGDSFTIPDPDTISLEDQLDSDLAAVYKNWNEAPQNVTFNSNIFGGNGGTAYIGYGSGADGHHQMEDFVGANIDTEGSQVKIGVENTSNGAVTGTEVARVPYGDRFYVNTSFNAGNLTVSVYSDANRTSLIDSATISYVPQPYKYAFAYTNPNGSQTDPISGRLDHYQISGHSGTTVSGSVTTNDGTPVSNATVKILGVDHAQLDYTDPQELKQEANDLLQKAKNATPSSWKPGFSVTENLLSKVNGEYVAVHTEDSWGLTGYTDTPDLSQPSIRVPAKERVILSVWDAANNPTIQDGVDSDLPGTVVDDTDIVIKQLGPSGDVVSQQTTSTVQTYEVGGFGGSHDYAQTYLQRGFYEVHPEGSPQAAYTIVAGDPQKIFQGYVEDLKNERGNLLQRAEWIRNQLNSGKFTSITVSTNATGHWSASVGSNVKTVSVTAYKGPYELIGTEPANTTVSDIREIYETTELNQSVYMPASANRVDVPQSNVTVRVIEATSPGYLNMSRFENLRDKLRAFLENLSYSKLPSMIQSQLENLSRERLEKLYSELEGLRQNNQALRDRVNQLLESDSIGEDADDLTRTQLQARIQALQQAMTELRNSIESGDPSSNINGDTVSLSFPFQADVDPSQVMVLAHLSDGQTRTLGADSEYVSVESNTFGGSTVHVNDYPLANKSANVANFEVRVANSNGMGRSKKSVTNPSFEGDVPGLDAVSFNTLRPGASDHVEMTLQPGDDTAYRNLTSATVYGPTGTPIATDIIGGRTIKFETAGVGSHLIQAEFATANGETWTLTQRIQAGQSDRDMPPGIRLSDTPYGTIAVTGDGLEDGSVESSAGGQSITVTGQFASADDIPSKPIHIYTSGLNVPSTADVSVQLVEGEQKLSIGQHKRVVVHMPQMTAGSGGGLLSIFSSSETYYRNGQAMPRGESKHGVIEQRGGSLVIETYTNSEGEVTVSTSNAPGTLDTIQYRIDLALQSVPSISEVVPSIDFNFGGLPGVGMMIPVGLAVAAGSRRRKS